MKKILILSLAFWFSNIALSQSCLPEGITFTTQSQIDSFAINYPGCTIIEGDLIIYGDSSVTNLDSLNLITMVGGYLSFGFYNPNTNEIEGCPNLADITGMSNLDSIGMSLLIMGDNKLKNLVGLGNLEAIGGWIVVDDSDSIINLEGLEKLNSLDGLKATKNNSLVNFHGLENITFLEGDLIIGGYDILNMYLLGNPNLENMEGLNNLREVEGSITVTGNNALIDFSGLESLISSSRLEIISNSQLQSLNGLENLQTLNGDLWISENFYLLDILALANLDPSGIDDLLITYNFELSVCQAKSICTYLNNPDALYGIQDNAAGCLSKDEILELCNSAITEKNSENNLSIYPNPASDVLHVESSEEVESVCIFDGQGGQVVGWSGGQGKVEIPVGGLMPGLYLVRVETESGVVARKVVVGR